MTAPSTYDPSSQFPDHYYELTDQAPRAFLLYLSLAAAESRRRQLRRKTPIAGPIASRTWVHQWTVQRAAAPSRNESVLELWPARKDQQDLWDDNVPPMVFHVLHDRNQFSIQGWVSVRYASGRFGRHFARRLVARKLAS